MAELIFDIAKVVQLIKPKMTTKRQIRTKKKIPAFKKQSSRLF